MADEITRTATWLYDTLTGETDITDLVSTRVYSDFAPQGSTLPAVIFSLEYARDVTTAFHHRVMVDGLWRVRAVTDSGSFDDDLQALADAIDVLLDRSDGGTADTATIFTSVREEPYQSVVTDEGVRYHALGGVYRILVQIP